MQSLIQPHHQPLHQKKTSTVITESQNKLQNKFSLAFICGSQAWCEGFLLSRLPPTQHNDDLLTDIYVELIRNFTNSSTLLNHEGKGTTYGEKPGPPLPLNPPPRPLKDWLIHVIYDNVQRQKLLKFLLHVTLVNTNWNLRREAWAASSSETATAAPEGSSAAEVIVGG